MMKNIASLLIVFILSLSAFAQAPAMDSDDGNDNFDEFQELNTSGHPMVPVVRPHTQITDTPSPNQTVNPIPDADPTLPRAMVNSSWRLPDGIRCRAASECISNLCLDTREGKVCGTPNVICVGQGGSCTNACDCCSNQCSAYNECTANGVNECIPNGLRYNADPVECCSHRGSPSTKQCQASPYQCLPLNEKCTTDLECCSSSCSAYGTCRTNINGRRLFNGTTSSEAPAKVHKKRTKVRLKR